MKVSIFIHYSKRKNNQTYAFFLILVFSKKIDRCEYGGSYTFTQVSMKFVLMRSIAGYVTNKNGEKDRKHI